MLIFKMGLIEEPKVKLRKTKILSLMLGVQLTVSFQTVMHSVPYRLCNLRPPYGARRST